MYIFPMLEAEQAIQDHIKDPFDTRKMLHLEAMLAEVLINLRIEMKKKGMLKDTMREGK